MSDIYEKHYHRPEKRVECPGDPRSAFNMLLQVGFDLVKPLELNPMLPEGAQAEDANVLIWKNAGPQLGIDMDRMYAELNGLDMDRFKWSCRAPKSNGLQEKRALRNCCVTDPGRGRDRSRRRRCDDRASDAQAPQESLDQIHELRLPWGELAHARRLIPAVLGPYGYKMKHQFAEINDYYDSTCGIGRHGDVERGKGGIAGRIRGYSELY